MSYCYLFTCGTSLLENLEKKEPAIANRLRAIIPEVGRVLSGNLEADWAGTPGDSSDPGAKWTLERWGSLPLDDEMQTAEMASLGHLHLTQQDEVVLIASDTPEGVFCAVINAWLMVGLVGKVEIWERAYQDSARQLEWGWRHPAGLPHIQQKSIARQKAAVLRVKHLDPRSRERFEQKGGAANLIQTIADLVWKARTHQLDPVIIFTGGFKASIPLLTQAATWLDRVPLMGLYEGAQDMVRVPTLHAAPDIEACQAVLGFGAGKAGHPFHGQLDSADHSAKRQVSQLPPNLQPLFQDKPSRTEIEFSLLGQTLKAVIESELSSPHKEIELERIRGTSTSFTS